jgi:predicted alpha/beta-fold hydrolase
VRKDRRFQKMGRFLAKLMRKANKVGTNIDKYQEAVTFAEAGEQEHVKELFQADVEVAEERAGKLLVVGREGTFSKEIMDYALDMAQRLHYEILALNTAALSGETFRLFSASHKKLSEDFRELAEKNAQHFHEEADRLGVAFAHMVKFSARDEAIQEINKEFSNIEFVVSDSEEERPAERNEEGARASQPIYVYSMTT